MTTITGDIRAAIADGLRALADDLNADERIPLGMFAASQGWDVAVGVDNPADVLHAAAAQDATVEVRNGHTVTRLRYGLVELKVYAIDPAAQARHQAQDSYRPNVAAGMAVSA